MGVTQVIIFDLDGTLVDSAGDIALAASRVLAVRGLPALSREMVIPLIGEGARRLMERALFEARDGAREPSPADVDEALAEFLATYAANLTQTTVAYAGVDETLAALTAQGYRHAVCTNKPEAHARTILHRLGLDGHFASVIGGDSVAGTRKPDPAMVQPILDFFGVAPSAAILVGDSPTDVRLARAAGMPVVVRRGGYSTVPAADLGADRLIDDFAALPAAIESLDAPSIA